MSLIAVADIAHPDLALVPTIREVTDVAIQVVPHSATDAETGMFFFLVESEDGTFEGFEAALDADHTVDEWLLVADSETSRIYRLCHTDSTKLLSPKTTEVGGLMREATSNIRGWTVSLQVPDREALSTLWEFCASEDISFELVSVYRQEEWAGGEGAPLTEAQRVALVTAFEAGYFEEPRATSLEELAEQLDISPTAVGGRLRRGMAELVEATLVED